MLKTIALALPLALALAGTAASPAHAVDEVNVSKGLTLDGAPLALRGVDPVTLATKNEVAAGVATRTVVHDGVAYYFASDTSADAFMAAPEKYMPQYGGYCAFAVALGKKLDGDPRYADIVDGKLYLFVNAGVFAKYKETPAEILATAEKTWGKIADKAVSSL